MASASEYRRMARKYRDLASSITTCRDAIQPIMRNASTTFDSASATALTNESGYVGELNTTYFSSTRAQINRTSAIIDSLTSYVGQLNGKISEANGIAAKYDRLASAAEARERAAANSN